MASVVIPTYNGAEFIAESLRSVLEQSELPDEIVVVDDCSSDETAAIVKAIGQKAPIPVRFLCLPRNSGGPSAPLNVGIEAAVSPRIVLLEQDDLMRSNRIEKQLRALAAHPENLIIGRFNILGNQDGDMAPIWDTPQLSAFEGILPEQFEHETLDSRLAFRALMSKNFTGSNSNFCFNRNLWRDIGGFDENVATCVDLDFALKAVMKANITIVSDVLFHYRWRSTSLNRLNMDKTVLEATLVRLRAASALPEWAGSELHDLQHTILAFAQSEVKAKHLWKTAAITKDIFKYGGLQTFGPLVDRLKRNRRVGRNGKATAAK